MDWQAWIEEAKDYFRSAWGLEPAFCRQVALLYLYFVAYGLNPRITSGFRDPKHQAELRRRWDAGDRQGLAVRPAAVSDHTRRIAVDIVTSDPAKAAMIARALGIGAGYDFKVRDAVHFYKKA